MGQCHLQGPGGSPSHDMESPELSGPMLNMLANWDGEGHDEADTEQVSPALPACPTEAL